MNIYILGRALTPSLHIMKQTPNIKRPKRRAWTAQAAYEVAQPPCSRSVDEGGSEFAPVDVFFCFGFASCIKTPHPFPLAFGSVRRTPGDRIKKSTALTRAMSAQ